MTPNERTGHPLVDLMRRYCCDYVNRHDLTVCDEIMAPEYTLQMGPHVLRGRDDVYKPAVEAQYRQFPDLALVVHELITNGERIAMRFSEHGASVKHDGRRAAWAGAALYRWNGTVLTENWVEQDYLARSLQLETGRPHDLEALALDPWATTREPSNEPAEKIVRSWLETGQVLSDQPPVDHRQTPNPRLDIDRVEIDDMFSAGSRVAFHATIHGRYAGGLNWVDGYLGVPVTYALAGIGTITPDGVQADLVTDRLGLVKALRKPR